MKYYNKNPKLRKTWYKIPIRVTSALVDNPKVKLQRVNHESRFFINYYIGRHTWPPNDNIFMIIEVEDKDIAMIIKLNYGA
jgi:hypothetical protein